MATTRRDARGVDQRASTGAVAFEDLRQKLPSVSVKIAGDESDPARNFAGVYRVHAQVSRRSHIRDLIVHEEYMRGGFLIMDRRHECCGVRLRHPDLIRHDDTFDEHRKAESIQTPPQPGAAVIREHANRNLRRPRSERGGGQTRGESSFELCRPVKIRTARSESIPKDPLAKTSGPEWNSKLLEPASAHFVRGLSRHERYPCQELRKGSIEDDALAVEQQELEVQVAVPHAAFRST